MYFLYICLKIEKYICITCIYFKYILPHFFCSVFHRHVDFPWKTAFENGISLALFHIFSVRFSIGMTTFRKSGASKRQRKRHFKPCSIGQGSCDIEGVCEDQDS